MSSSTLLTTNQQVSDFADAIAATIRPFSGSTGIGEAISFAANRPLAKMIMC